MSTGNNDQLVAKLVAAGKERLLGPRVIVDFETGFPDAEQILNDIEHYPHIFVLACVMDKQVRAGRAWSIPYLVGRELGGFDFPTYCSADRAKITSIFNLGRLHRFNDVMGECFHSAVRDIDSKYVGDASKIWNEPPCPKSALIVRRFLEFRGVGVKIATMATNILARDFKIQMSEYASIDISPDVQVTKFLISAGLLNANAKKEELIYLARELSPDYPGALDLPSWEAGRKLPGKH